MEPLVAGDLVVSPFPNSGSASFKPRPCVVLATWRTDTREDALVCMITTRDTGDPYAIKITSDDIVGGVLKQESFVRPTYMYGGPQSLLKKIGRVRPELMRRIVGAISDVLPPVG